MINRASPDRAILGKTWREEGEPLKGTELVFLETNISPVPVFRSCRRRRADGDARRGLMGGRVRVGGS